LQFTTASFNCGQLQTTLFTFAELQTASLRFA